MLHDIITDHSTPSPASCAQRHHFPPSRKRKTTTMATAVQTSSQVASNRRWHHKTDSDGGEKSSTKHDDFHGETSTKDSSSCTLPKFNGDTTGIVVDEQYSDVSTRNGSDSSKKDHKKHFSLVQALLSMRSQPCRHASSLCQLGQGRRQRPQQLRRTRWSFHNISHAACDSQRNARRILSYLALRLQKLSSSQRHRHLRSLGPGRKGLATKHDLSEFLTLLVMSLLLLAYICRSSASHNYSFRRRGHFGRPDTDDIVNQLQIVIPRIGNNSPQDLGSWLNPRKFWSPPPIYEFFNEEEDYQYNPSERDDSEESWNSDEPDYGGLDYRTLPHGVEFRLIDGDDAKKYESYRHVTLKHQGRYASEDYTDEDLEDTKQACRRPNWMFLYRPSCNSVHEQHLELDASMEKVEHDGAGHAPDDQVLDTFYIRYMTLYARATPVA